MRIARQSRRSVSRQPAALRRRPARRARGAARPGGLQVAQVAERLVQPPVAVVGVERARRRRAGRPRRRSAARSRERARARARRRSATSARLASMCAGDVGERAAVARQAEPRVERARPRRASAGTRRPGRACSRSRSTARRGRAGGRRRSAARRSGWKQADVRGRVAGRLEHVPGAEVGRDLDAGEQVAVGRRRRRRCRSARAAPRSAQRRSGSSGTPLWRATSMRRCERRLGVLRRARRVLVVRVHPQLAAGALDDRRRLAAVVGVGVGA